MKKLLFLCAILISVASFSQNSKIKELEQQRKLMLREISNTDKLLKTTKQTTSTLLERIKLISNQIFSRQKVLGLLEQEITGIAGEQTQIEKDILVLEAQLLEKQKNYAKAIDGMLHNRQNRNKMMFILSGKSLTESYRRLRYLQEYSEWRSKQADEIQVKSNELKDKKVALAKARSEKLALLSQRESEQKNLKTEEVNYQQEVGEAQKKQKELQKTLAQKQKEANVLNNQIARLIAEEVARQEREARRRAEEQALAEARKKEAEKKNIENTGSKKKNTPKSSTSTTNKTASTASTNVAPIATSENISLSNNFSANKGKLPYPITGNYTVIQHFGAQQHGMWNVTTSNNGIDIQSQSGAEAKSVFAGEISRVVAFPGYNNCIIIRHGNYYTFYGNIQNVYVKQGERVKTGQALGKVYTDSETNRSQMHFQLWQGTNKLNPEPWLR